MYMYGVQYIHTGRYISSYIYQTKIPNQSQDSFQKKIIYCYLTKLGTVRVFSYDTYIHTSNFYFFKTYDGIEKWSETRSPDETRNGKKKTPPSANKARKGRVHV